MAFPVLLKVIARGELVEPTDWVPKLKLFVERPATAAVPPPVPERAIIWGLPLALSAMATEAVRLPAETGVNVTDIVQLPPATTEAPQVLVALKSPASAPVTAIPLISSVALPVLVRVAVFALLVVPRF